MYTPRAFVETDPARLDALFERDPFATLVTTGTDGLPCATHLPVLYRRDGERVLIEGHWAKPNPQAALGNDGLLIVNGPHAYVSASWYPDKEDAARVPTWNYATAHLYGTLERFNDEAGLADLVSRLSDHFEASVGQSWRFEPKRDDHRWQLRGIIGFRFVPTRIEVKAKLSQNHPLDNRIAVIAALEQLGTPAAGEVAAWMRETLP